MNNNYEKSGFKFSVENNILKYSKTDYAPAQDWKKNFKDGSYAYQNPTSGPDPLYFGARYMEATLDEEKIVQNNLMVDLTVINPGHVGDEFVKTVGHYHGIIPGETISYPEVYEAVSEGFEYLLQSTPDENGKVDVIWVITEPGDKVIMPPNWGHVSMNVSGKTAFEVDVQKRDNPNDSDYSLFKEKRGGAFYRTENGLIKNPNYKVNTVKIVRPLEKPEWGLVKPKPLYLSLIESPEKFEYLTNPVKFSFDLNDFFVEVEPGLAKKYLRQY